MNLEHDLRHALRRQPGPSDLADRVLARIAQDTPSRPHRTMPWLAAAAAVTLVATGATRYYAYQQQVAEAERVKEEIRVALQITSETLAHVQRRVESSLQHEHPQGIR
jgi:hypothetical protein